jgi:hypothetical protein
MAHCFKTIGFILAAALFAGTSFVTHAVAQEFPFEMFSVDLNSNTARQLWGLGSPYIDAWAINDAGVTGKW